MDMEGEQERKKIHEGLQVSCVIAYWHLCVCMCMHVLHEA